MDFIARFRDISPERRWLDAAANRYRAGPPVNLGQSRLVDLAHRFGHRAHAMATGQARNSRQKQEAPPN